MLQICRANGALCRAMALGKELKTAPASAYVAVEKIHFDGTHFRRAIAAKAIDKTQGSFLCIRKFPFFRSRL